MYYVKNSAYIIYTMKIYAYVMYTSRWKSVGFLITNYLIQKDFIHFPQKTLGTFWM